MSRLVGGKWAVSAGAIGYTGHVCSAYEMDAMPIWGGRRCDVKRAIETLDSDLLGNSQVCLFVFAHD